MNIRKLTTCPVSLLNVQLKLVLPERQIGLIFRVKTLQTKVMLTNLEQLIGIAGLRTFLDAEMNASIAFAANWNIKKDRDVKSRFVYRSA
ncbi:MAG TPA: hypothetical protein VGI82_04275 [Chitinophagaceae bacterium]